MGAVEESLLQYGALGILALFLALAVRVLFQQVKDDKQRETERADRNENALRELNATVQKEILPAALELVSTTKQLITIIAELQARQRNG